MTSTLHNRTSSNEEKTVTDNGPTQARLLTFNHSNVCVPGLMESVNIKSQFPRLKPKFERKLVQNHDIEVLSANLLDWLNSNFATAGREQYFKEITSACVIFAVYINPIPELYSDEMDLCIKILGWIGCMDDALEDAIETKVSFEVLKQGNGKLTSILLGKYDTDCNFEDVSDYPSFGSLFNSLLELHRICQKSLPEYGKRVLAFHDRLLNFFAMQVSFSIDEIDKRHSEENFIQFRKAVAFFDGCLEIVALIHGVTLSDEILRSPTLRRLLDIANAFGGYSNDLCGMKKEFANGQKDNLIVFKVMEKNIPIKVAVEQVCKLVESELSDYLLLKEVILKEFGYESNLVRYLDMLESLCDGQHMLYVQSKRHRSAESITLSQ